MKMLQKGDWVRFIEVPPGTTEKDIQDLFLNRTGVEIPLDRIAMNVGRDGCNAIVSLGGEHFIQILQWVFSEDTINGAPVQPFKYERHRFEDAQLAR